MKSFRMMSLPLIVGALILFCGASGARAATDCDWALALDNHPISAANIMDVKSLFAGETNLGLIFYDLPASFNAGQLVSPNGAADRIFILTFHGLSAGIVAGIASVSPTTSIPTVSAASIPTVATGASLTTVATAEAVTTATPTCVPESPSLLYLGSGLVLCGGFWLRRRRF
jgi:hypothetical protein